MGIRYWAPIRHTSPCSLDSHGILHLNPLPPTFVDPILSSHLTTTSPHFFRPPQRPLTPTPPARTHQRHAHQRPHESPHRPPPPPQGVFLVHGVAASPLLHGFAHVFDGPHILRLPPRLLRCPGRPHPPPPFLRLPFQFFFEVIFAITPHRAPSNCAVQQKEPGLPPLHLSQQTYSERTPWFSR